MKLLISIVFLLTLVRTVQAELPFEVTVREGRIWVEKYRLGERPVFNDEERDKIIATAVDTGTGTINLAHFIPVNISTHILAVVDELNGVGRISSRSRAIADIEKRMDPNYVNDEMAKERSLLQGYLLMKQDGLDVDAKIALKRKRLNNLKGRRDNPIQ